MVEDRILGDLAFIYTACSHLTDGELTRDEMRVLAAKIQAWDADASLDRMGDVLRTAVGAYQALDSVEAKLAETSARSKRLAESLDDARRRVVIGDLESIAAADGEVGDNERRFVDAVKKTFGLG